jgi:hypothetical protein
MVAVRGSQRDKRKNHKRKTTDEIVVLTKMPRAHGRGREQFDFLFCFVLFFLIDLRTPCFIVMQP